MGGESSWRSAIAAAGALACAGSGAHAQDKTPSGDPATDAEACIRQNVARVEQAVESLSEATTFLTEQLCAPAVAHEARVEQQEQMEAQRVRMQEMCEEQQSAGGFLGGLGAGGACDTLQYWEEDYWGVSSDVVYAGTVPANIVGLASSLLLEARLARAGAAESAVADGGE